MRARPKRLAWFVLAAALTSAVALAQPPAARPAAKGATGAAHRAASAAHDHAQAMVGWHAATAGKAPPVDASGRPMLALYTLNHGNRLTVPASTDKGGFSASDLDKIAHLLRAATGDEHPMDPRTIDILYRIQTHFLAQEIRVVSGYRVPRPGSHSNHGKGRAVDFVLPGTPDAEVAKFARQIGFVGVGVYPTSQFVHVDIRPRSYFWIDYSGPGKRNRERGILGDLAQKSDREATARGDKPIEPFENGTDVDAALRARAAQAAAADDDDDDAD